METLLQQADRMQKDAWKIIEETRIISIWQEIGATINLIGSLKTGLMINHRDIDFHIYTDPFILQDSFRAIAQIAEHSRIKTVQYTNLLDAEDRCIEWHATFTDNRQQTWQIDMIHILADSPYAGYFERVSERILAALTPESTAAILRIKMETAASAKIPAISIYQAVLQEHITDTDHFMRWYADHQQEGVQHWMPEENQPFSCSKDQL